VRLKIAKARKNEMDNTIYGEIRNKIRKKHAFV